MARGKKSKLADRPKAGNNLRQQGASFKRPSPNLIRGSTNTDRETATFTLRDAARKNHAGALWGTANVDLRHRAIAFVNSEDAGLRNLEGTIKDAPQICIPVREPDDTADRMTHPSSAPIRRNSSTLSFSLAKGVEPQPSDTVHPDEAVSRIPTIDTTDMSNEYFKTPQRSASRSSTDSSEEIVLFSGRKGPLEPTVGVSDPQGSCSAIQHQVASNQSNVQRKIFFDAEPKITTGDWDNSGRDWVHSHQRNIPTPHHQEFLSYSGPDASEEDAFLADYIENVRNNEELEDSLDPELSVTSPLEHLDLRLSAEDTLPSQPKLTRTIINEDASGWQPSDLEDFGGLSTSDDILEAIESVLSKRIRPGGVQYLIVWKGQSVDEARWIPKSSLDMPGAAELIQNFEDLARLLPSDVIDSSANEDEDDYEAGHQHNTSSTDDEWHERDLEKRHILRMTDEEIAKLLSKQEELGMGSEELLIFDDSGKHLGVIDMEGDETNMHSLSVSRKKLRTARSKKTRHPKGVSFAFADEMLDGENYGDFDILDRDRPSLSGKGKFKSAATALELSDSDLEATLHESWAADRKKKSLKKREREELRAQGLLGKKNKYKPDLTEKYQEGMSMEQIKTEIESFLINDHESLALPPLDKKDRKIIHEVAHAFNLKSKSVGTGRSRFPILYKTSRTGEYDAAVFPLLQVQLNRQFFSRMDRRGKGSRVPMKGGIGPADISYRDGEVVGASAPEIGVENRGRAMLEKMGWSSGTALGALNNKGILEPVSHVVRKSKAGLG